jgi:hypothetical protein
LATAVPATVVTSHVPPACVLWHGNPDAARVTVSCRRRCGEHRALHAGDEHTRLFAAVCAEVGAVDRRRDAGVSSAGEIVGDGRSDRTRRRR